MKLCLVCSSGGHLLQLASLKELWDAHDRFWVSFPSRDSEYLLHGERAYWAHSPTRRNIPNLARNFVLAYHVLRDERPDAVISTGAAIAVPFLYVARLMHIKTIFIESLTRVRTLSLSGLFVYPVAQHMLVQWPELVERYGKAEYAGQVI